MYQLVRQVLFLFAPEKAHYLAMDLLSLGLKIPGLKSWLKSTSKNQDVFRFQNLVFPNKLGLAAGFDKNAQYLKEIKALGFGHVEIGTVTPLAQNGNPQPRLFRLKKDQALVNRMGFNNEGMERVLERLKNRPEGLVIGGNIGKNKDTPNEDAAEDYLKCFKTLYHYVDYFSVNVSSPNTPGLRALQGKDELLGILNTLVNERQHFALRKPILLKITADLSNEQIKDAVDVVNQSDVDGIVISNTTLDRAGLQTTKATINRIGAGGLSGRPLTEKAKTACKLVAKNLLEEKLLIGVGGIMNQEDAQERLKAGAHLVQLYTGFVYSGPALIKKIVRL